MHPDASHVSAMSAPTVETAAAEPAGVEAAAAMEGSGAEAAAMKAGAIETSAMKAGAKAAMKAASVAEPEWKVAPVIGIVVVIAERRVVGGLVVLAILSVIWIVAIDRRIGL